MNIEKFLPSVLRTRNDESRKWLEVQIKELNKPVTNVEEYVE